MQGRRLKAGTDNFGGIAATLSSGGMASALNGHVRLWQRAPRAASDRIESGSSSPLQLIPFRGQFPSEPMKRIRTGALVVISPRMTPITSATPPRPIAWNVSKISSVRLKQPISRKSLISHVMGA